MWIFLLGMSILVVCAGWVMIIRRVHAKRVQALVQQPFPARWENILRRNITIYHNIPADLREQLHNDIKRFLAEKHFEGCGGLTITEEIRVTIAGEACMLLLNRPNRDFPRLKTILVYPHAYRATGYARLGDNYIEQESLRAGESWARGSLVLAWDHVINGARNGEDGHNVVLHEFAHQLDQEDGVSDGAPPLGKRERYRAWARVLGREFEQLRDDLDHHRRNVLDEYGATNPAEFFAVATETFFEKPRQLQQNEPELYNQLKDYYQLDPATWKGSHNRVSG